MIGAQLRRLGRHSAIYGLGGLVSRILAVLLLPLYTSYLDPADYGRVETLVALSAILVVVLRAGISTAFFRFYFDSPEPAERLQVLRTSFWFTMAMSTLGLVLGWIFAPAISGFLHIDDDTLVRAAFVGLWAQMNYEQLTSLFRVEERSVAFVAASLANVLLTIGTTILLVVAFDEGALGVVVGNFTGTLLVYLALLGYRREQLGLQFDRALLRRMNRFGLPLVPSGLALWALNFSDRFFLARIAGQEDVGRYSLGVRIASAMVLLLVAFRMAWPAFAVLDRRRPRGAPDVRVRAHVSPLRLVLALARARRARAVDRPAAREERGLLAGRRRRRAARVRRRRSGARTRWSRSGSAVSAARSSTG